MNISQLTLLSPEQFQPSQDEIHILGLPSREQRPPPPENTEMKTPFQHRSDSKSGMNLTKLGICATGLGLTLLLFDDNIFNDVCRISLPTSLRYDRMSRLYLKFIILTTFTGGIMWITS